MFSDLTPCDCNSGNHPSWDLGCCILRSTPDGVLTVLKALKDYASLSDCWEGVSLVYDTLPLSVVLLDLGYRSAPLATRCLFSKRTFYRPLSWCLSHQWNSLYICLFHWLMKFLVFPKCLFYRWQSECWTRNTYLCILDFH